ncbi:MAG TPA: tetratricopeptide repeat protein [Terriglobales bacterium]|jgi:tetratricopeptide (TPR) repeat protein|nr:tetratricopeptide repeat protein [Terriglobales bacterium]
MQICLIPRHYCRRGCLPGAAILVALMLSASILALGQISPSTNSATRPDDRLPISTNSPEAARLFEEGLHLRYDYHTDRALSKWREAAMKDPNFAQAWTYIVWFSLNPAEVKMASGKAQLASQNITPGEKLLVKWVLQTNDGHFLNAIAAMNDLMTMYPRDARLNYEAGLWLQSQSDYEGAVKFTKRALEIDPNFAGALNTLGYDFAFMHQYDQAIPYLKRYAEVEPNDPNPLDSLAEILQQAGRLEESLTEYREALRLDPRFYHSQNGLGDVYALLGNQDRARQEYAKALPMTQAPTEKLDSQIQSGISYAREGNVKQARTELDAALAQATKLKLNAYESSIHQYLALLAESHAAAFEHLEQSEEALKTPAHMSGKARNRELARTLEIRARLAAEAGNLALAQTAVDHLQKMVQTTRSSMVERAYHGANGTLLAAQSKVSAAIEELKEDPENAFSMAKLEELEAASGDAQGAAQTRARLKADFGTTLDDWLVVREFRQ